MRCGRSALLTVMLLVVDIGGAAQREIDHAGGDRFVGIAIDQDEGAGIAVVGVGIERDRPRDRQIANADFVQRQRLGGELRQRVDVDRCLSSVTVAATVQLLIFIR